MKGLVKKDLLMIKSNLKIICIIFIVFFMMALQGEFDLTVLPVMISVMMFMSTFSYDEYNKWDAYAITLPNGRKNIVKSKYIATLILVLLSALIAVILNIIIGYIENNLNYEEIFSVMAGSTFGIIIVISILYPLVFKIGIEKGRIWLFISAFILAAVFRLLSEVIDVNISVDVLLFLEKYLIVILGLLVVIFLSVSYKVSEKIYLKKEF